MRSSGPAGALPSTTPAQPVSAVAVPASRQRPQYQPARTGSMRDVQAPPPTKSTTSWLPRQNVNTTGMQIAVVILVIYIFAVLLPFSMAVGLLTDQHYKFWFGNGLPLGIVFFAIFMPIVFAVLVYMLALRHHAYAHSEDTMLLVGVTFAAFLGVFLTLIALPVSANTGATTMQLAYGCDISNAKAANLLSYSTVLHNIRHSPGCSNQSSVTACKGYAENEYTQYLRELEADFGCTGMCTVPTFAPPSQVLLASGTHVQHHPVAVDHGVKRHEVGTHDGSSSGGKSKLSFLQESAVQLFNKKAQTPVPRYLTHVAQSGASFEVSLLQRGQPAPAQMLFSQGTANDACFPLLADNLRVSVGSASDVLFWQGIGLICAAILAGVMKVADQCIFEKDLEYSNIQSILQADHN